MPTKKIKDIQSVQDLKDFAETYGLRKDWHEPDEESIHAEVIGHSFDNAGFYGLDHYLGKEFSSPEYSELAVVFYFGNKPVAMVNLASLCAMAAGTWKERK